MKLIITIFALVLLTSGSLFAGDVTYRASMTGIECSACKKSIARSLGKLDGVKTIRIAKGSGEKHTLTVITDGSSSISKSDAVKALGKNAPHYQLVTWSRSS